MVDVNVIYLRGLSFNQLNPSYQVLGAQLSQQVPNPFYGLVSTGTLSTPTVARSQLLLPFPQYAGISATGPPQQENIGSSSYSLEVKAEHRLSGGVYLLASYTAGKLISDSSGRIVNFGTPYPPIQNNYDLAAERSLDEGDVSRRLVISHTIDLPVGRGQRLLGSASGIENQIVGGWAMNGAFSYNTGYPLQLTSTGNSGVGAGVLRPNYTGQPAKLSGSVESRLNEYFNTTAFSIPPSYTFGNVSRTLGNVRSPSRWDYDLSLQKQFPIKESWALLFRAEAYNLLNTPYFLPPGSSLGSSSFGVISSSMGERQVQLALKLVF